MAKKQLSRSQIKKLLGRRLKDFIPVERAAPVIDMDKRTVEMSFSSDAPIEHWFGRLILNHDPKCIRTARILAGGPFLVDHDRTQLAGVHESYASDGHKARGVIRFSKSDLGESILNDINDGIRPNVSTGVRLYELHLVREDDDGPVYQSDDWEPVENSSVTAAADITVGVGRDVDDDAECAGDDCDGCAECEPPDGDGDADDEEEQSRSTNSDAERQAPADTSTQARNTMERDEEIRSLGEMLGEEELAREFIADETRGDAKAFKAAVREKQKAARTAALPPAEDPAATAARQGGATQLARSATRAVLRNFRGEGAEERALRAGHFMRAALYEDEASRQFCREHGIVLKRAQSESDNESGGFLVPTEFENVLIDLRLEYGVFRRNANVVPMSSLRKERPRRKGGLKAYPIGARGSNRRLTESKKGWDLVGLDAKKWGVLAKYEEELSDDSVIAMADDLAGEIAYAFTSVEDECGFLGDGSSDFHGITGLIPKLQGLSGTVGQIAGIQVASGNQWSEIVLLDILGLVGKLPSFARKSGQVKWYCSNEFWATVLCRIALLLGGSAVAEVQNEITPVFLGKPVEITEVMPHTEANSQVPLLYGNLAQAAMFGDRRGVTIKMTDSNDTDFEEDLMAIKGTERFDVNVHDVGNADASAAKRQAGPVVALQTAAN